MNKCTTQVRMKTTFPRYRQCSRSAVTTDQHGNPVCHQHSPAAQLARRDKREAAEERKRNALIAYYKAKNQHPHQHQTP